MKPNSILTIKLNKPIEERSIKDPFAILTGDEYSNMGLNDILNSIKQAKENVNIQGIYLEAGYYIDIPKAYLEEVRRA